MNHGTISCYTNHECRCDPCRKAWRDYARERRLDPGPRVVDATETREHAVALLAAGHSATAIADVAWISRGGVQKIARSAHAKVRTVTADRILGIPIYEAMSGHYVPTALAEPLVDEMMQSGIRMPSVYSAAGLHPKYRLDRRRRVTWTTWRRLRTVYGLLARQGMVRTDILLEVGP